MRKGFACFLTVCMVVSTLGGCGNSKGTYESAGSEKKVGLQRRMQMRRKRHQKL